MELARNMPLRRTYDGVKWQKKEVQKICYEFMLLEDNPQENWQFYFRQKMIELRLKRKVNQPSDIYVDLPSKRLKFSLKNPEKLTKPQEQNKSTTIEISSAQIDKKLLLTEIQTPQNSPSTYNEYDVYICKTENVPRNLIEKLNNIGKLKIFSEPEVLSDEVYLQDHLYEESIENNYQCEENGFFDEIEHDYP